MVSCVVCTNNRESPFGHIPVWALQETQGRGQIMALWAQTTPPKQQCRCGVNRKLLLCQVPSQCIWYIIIVMNSNSAQTVISIL